MRTKALKKLGNLSFEKKTLLVPPLLQALTAPEPRLAGYAVEALVVMGRPCISEVRKTLQNPDVYVRLSGISILGRLGAEAEEAVPDLATALEDPHPLIRDEAAFALGQMGMAAETAGPALLQAFKKAAQNDKETIAETLKKIGLQPPVKKSLKR